MKLNSTYLMGYLAVFEAISGLTDGIDLLARYFNMNVKIKTFFHADKIYAAVYSSFHKIFM